MFDAPSLIVSSDERLRPLVHAFGREFARAVALPDGEGVGLVAALDRAMRFVCGRAYPDDPAGRIEVRLEAAERGVRASLHDWGRPLTSAEGPAALVDLGTGVQELRLINLGADGKRLSFVWRTTHPVAVADGVADAPTTAVAATTAIDVRDGAPEDAEPIAQLLYDNYALSYVHPDFYRPRWLREQLATGRVLSTVAVHGGDVVGHHALLPAARGPAAETGIAVVAPAYRGLGIFGRLAQHTLARAAASGLQAVYGQAVTMHPYSQRAELAHGYHETAVCLAAAPATTMRAIASDTGRRRALMVSFLPLQRGPRKASLPQRHRGRLLETYAALGLPAPTPGRGRRGRVSVAHDREAATAVVTIGGWDDELAGQAIMQVRTLLSEHVDVLYADLDLEAIVDPDSAVDALRDHGFSFSGLWPHGPGDHDHLRLQRLNCTDVELEEIATASAAGEALVRYVLGDLGRVTTRPV